MYEAAVRTLDSNLLEPKYLYGRPFNIGPGVKDAALAFREDFRTFMALISIKSPDKATVSNQIEDVDCNAHCDSFRQELERYYRSMSGNVLEQPAMRSLRKATYVCSRCQEHYQLVEHSLAEKIWENLPIWAGGTSWEDFVVAAGVIEDSELI